MTPESALKRAFSEGLNVESDQIDWENLEYRGIPQWDSVAHMAVVAEIEDAFDVMLEVDDVIGMSSYKVTKDILAKYGLAFA